MSYRIKEEICEKFVEVEYLTPKRVEELKVEVLVDIRDTLERLVDSIYNMESSMNERL